MINGVNHIGLSVADLERSIAFYRELLGMTVVAEAVFGDERYERIMALQGATGRVAMLQGTNLRIELFEFSRPVPRPADQNRPVCDHGITHFGLEVSDLDGMYSRLSAAGVRFHSPPVSFKKARATYARDPDGNVFELLELGGRAAGEKVGVCDR